MTTQAWAFKNIFDTFIIHQEETMSVLYAVLEGKGKPAYLG